MTDVLDRIPELAPDLDHEGARKYFERTRGTRHRRRRVASAALVIVVGTLGTVVAVSTISGGDEATVTSTISGTVAVDLVNLSGRVVTVRFPPRIAKGLETEALSATLDVDSNPWRLDVERTSASDRINQPPCESVPETVSSIVDSWKVTFTGDGMTSSSCQDLLDEMGSFVARNGTLVYEGGGDIGPVDSPDVVASAENARISLFHRSPSCSADSPRTPSGIRVERVDDPARGTKLTALCDDEESIELWIDAPFWPSEEEVNAVEVVHTARG